MSGQQTPSYGLWVLVVINRGHFFLAARILAFVPRLRLSWSNPEAGSG